MQSSIYGDIRGKWQSPDRVPAVVPVVWESQEGALVHRASQTPRECFACGAVFPAEDAGHPHACPHHKSVRFPLQPPSSGLRSSACRAGRVPAHPGAVRVPPKDPGV